MTDFSDNARWMVPPESERNHNPGSNEWFMLRNWLDVVQPQGVALRIAADSKYWLYINGTLVVREGGLKRGPVPDGSYYDVVDISSFLETGENSIAILLWYFGRQGFSHRDSGMPGLLVDADNAAWGDWRIKRHSAYFDAGYANDDSYRLSENSVGFDARHEVTGWTSPEFDDSAWPLAIEAGKPGDAPWGELEQREFAQWYWSELKEYDSVEVFPSPKGERYTCYRCRLPYNAHFVPALAADAKAGVRIDISAVHDTNRINSSYIAGEGRQQYEALGWMSGEEVIYEMPTGQVEVEAFMYRETGYPTDFTGSFVCDCDVLNKIWHMAQRTLYVTMRDNFMDCACRERAQWPGDMVIQLGQVPYCLGRETDFLVKKGIRETLRWQREDGAIYGPVPEGNWRMELPAQMLSVISPFGIWTYYMNSADRATLEELYPFAKRYLEIWDFWDNGLIRYRPQEKGEAPKIVDGVSVGVWDWIDWGEQIDCEPALNAWFVLAAQGVRQMAQELGLDEDVVEIERKEKQVRTAFRKQYWNESRGGYVSDGFEFAPDDRVQALAVLCDAATPDQYPQLALMLEQVEQASPYMEKYVLEALFSMGRPELALERMARRYRPIVESEYSTLPELFTAEDAQNCTINHSWSGGPLTLLSACVAGINPLEPGWTRVLVRPQPATLKHVQSSVITPFGEILFDLRDKGGDWAVELKIPEGIVATFDFSEVTDGKMLPRELTPGTWRGMIDTDAADCGLQLRS